MECGVHHQGMCNSNLHPSLSLFFCLCLPVVISLCVFLSLCPCFPISLCVFLCLWPSLSLSVSHSVSFCLLPSLHKSQNKYFNGASLQSGDAHVARTEGSLDQQQVTGWGLLKTEFCKWPSKLRSGSFPNWDLRAGSSSRQSLDYSIVRHLRQRT